MSAISIMTDADVQNTEVTAPEAGFGCVQTPLGNLPVKALDVQAKITGLVYEVTMRQTYVNRYEQPLEATYIFPLPDRAAVGDFKMIVAGRVIDGVLKERGEARREYQQAIEQGHRASIVEEERPDTFTMRVGNIEPGEEVTVEFKLTGPLVFADGEATFRFPLVVAPRYIPGTPLEGGNVGDGTANDTDAVPDASRITPPVLLPGFPNPIQLAIEVEIAESATPVRNIRSSLHAVTMERSVGGQRISIQPGERVNRDFILRFEVATEAVQSTATVKRDAEGKEGTWMVTVVPPSQAQGASSPRDIVFLLDRSGSMDGWKMVAARRALGRMLDTLTPADNFAIIAFDTVVEFVGPSALQAGTNRERYRAIEQLSKIEARGGTEMAQPIYQALDLVAGGYQNRRHMVVLITDGQVGNEQQILAGAAQRRKNARIFTVGIDQAVHAGFLNQLADLGGGRCELVESENRLDEAMDRIHRTIDTPVLTGLAVEAEGVELLRDETVPERAPDLFAGAPVTLFGRFRGDGAPVLTVKAQNRDGSAWNASLPAAEANDSAITTLWARRRVRALEDEYSVRRGESLSERITQLSLRFGVLCRFTSWVAVDREAKIEHAGDLRHAVQPVESPEGWAGGMPMPASMPYDALEAQAAPMAPQALSMAPRSGGGFFSGFGAKGAPAPHKPEPAARRQKQALKMKFETPDDAFRETETGTVKPGVRYISPELARGEAASLSSDVFALGVIAFEMLTGRALFQAAGPIQELANIISWDPSKLGREREIHGEWYDVLSKCLALNPADRYPSARELLEDLEARFGRDAMFGAPGWASSWADERPLSSLFGQLDETSTLVVFSWLVSHIAHEQQNRGGAVQDIYPAEIMVDSNGRARLGSATEPGLFDKLKRWLGFDAEPSKRGDFWK